MFNLLKGKKAELTTTQIVIIIILIASFLILLYFLFFYNPANVSEEELCYNSVVLSSGTSIAGSQTVDLDCRTKYVCITKDGGCEKMTDPEKIKVGNKEEVYLALAEEMRKCWSMFGEGKLEYVGDDILGGDLHCSICSQVAFDDSTKKIEGLSTGIIDREDFFKYLTSKKIKDSDLTYSEYLYEINNFEGFNSLLKEQNSEFGSIDTSKSHYIVMGIYAEGSDFLKVVTGTTIGVITIGGIIAAPFTGGASLGLTKIGMWLAFGGVAGGTGGYFIGNAIEGDSGYLYLRPTILEVNSDQFNSLSCKEVTTFT